MEPSIRRCRVVGGQAQAELMGCYVCCTDWLGIVYGSTSSRVTVAWTDSSCIDETEKRYQHQGQARQAGKETDQARGRPEPDSGRVRKDCHNGMAFLKIRWPKTRPLSTATATATTTHHWTVALSLQSPVFQFSHLSLAALFLLVRCVLSSLVRGQANDQPGPKAVPSCPTRVSSMLSRLMIGGWRSTAG